MKIRGRTEGKDKQALDRLRSFCVYRERCSHEVKEKLHSLSLTGKAAEKIIAVLAKEGFVDDERFSALYAGSKFRNHSWGRIKITAELRKRNVPEAIISRALDEISPGDYAEKIKSLASKKLETLRKCGAEEKKIKTLHYLFSKGFETGLCLDILRESCLKKLSP